MRQFLHNIYLLLGHIFCKMCLLYWDIRDFCFPPKEKAVLFVAHPDDDTLFFHTFIKEHKPYVCLCTAGWSLRRLPCFFKAMRYYGVRFRAYDMDTRDTRTELLTKRVRYVLSLGKFELCATHNATGEYGHEMHQRVHTAVTQTANIPVYTPSSTDELNKYPVTQTTLNEKHFIFRTIYTTETWVLDQYTHWVNHEHLVRFE